MKTIPMTTEQLEVIETATQTIENCTEGFKVCGVDYFIDNQNKITIALGYPQFIPTKRGLDEKYGKHDVTMSTIGQVVFKNGKPGFVGDSRIVTDMLNNPIDWKTPFLKVIENSGLQFEDTMVQK